MMLTRYLKVYREINRLMLPVVIVSESFKHDLAAGRAAFDLRVARLCLKGSD